MSKLVEQALAILTALAPTYNLDVLTKYPHKKVHIHGAGKSAPRMASELQALGVKANPLVIGLHSGHPIPDHRSIEGAKTLIKAAKKLGEDDLVLFCLSGGASSLIELPIDGLELEELQRIYGDLLLSGKTIHEINNERKKLSKIKDGLLGDYYLPAHVHCFIESDVEGDDPFDVGSSPILGNNNDHSYEVVLTKNHLIETTKIKLKDFYCTEINESLEENIKRHLELLATNSNVASCGECTIAVKGKGKGGRNTHWVACMGAQLHNLGKEFEVLSLGTDGRDGPTDAAGAYLDGRIPIDELNRAIKDFDTYTLFEKYQLLIKTGETGYNLNDLRLLRM